MKRKTNCFFSLAVLFLPFLLLIICICTTLFLMAQYLGWEQLEQADILRRKKTFNKSTEYCIEGEITAVSDKLPLVMISVGSDNKVQKGYKFSVYRKDKYVGFIIVEEVYKDDSAAAIEKYKTIIKEKDKVIGIFSKHHQIICDFGRRNTFNTQQTDKKNIFWQRLITKIFQIEEYIWRIFK